MLLGNLVRLDGSRLKRCTDATRPKKYYLFYYTASWCGPCQRYTPELVRWYKKNKNENFELVLITSDSNEDAMEDYAKSKKMPWPQLEFKEAKDFKKRFNHGVRGIPSLIVCELDGKNLGNFRSGLDRLSEMVK
jgi:nucleoredoxin